MSYLFFILKSALEDFRRNKIRTFLTSLGILIGVASVVLLMALGLGLKKYIAQQFESLGTGLVYILPGSVFSGGSFRGGASSVGGASFDDRDVSSLKKIAGAELVIPLYTKYVKAEAEGNNGTYQLIATTADIFSGLSVNVEYGQAFSKADADRGKKVVVIGPKIAEKLFGNSEAAVNRNLKIDTQAYKIFGVTKSRGGVSLGGPNFDEQIYMPFKAATSFNPNKKYYAVYMKGQDGVDSGLIKDEAKKTLLKRYKEDDFSVAKQDEILNAVNSIFSVLNTILIAIAAISLVVGGIGIMNIMYVSVVERTREVGIRRAIGAMQRDILMQFLVEAVVLSLFGGLMGLLISYLGVLGLQNFFPAYIDLPTVGIALGVSSAIGVVFGVFPARKAASLSPIEAIRYE